MRLLDQTRGYELCSGASAVTDGPPGWATAGPAVDRASLPLVRSQRRGFLSPKGARGGMGEWGTGEGGHDLFTAPATGIDGRELHPSFFPSHPLSPPFIAGHPSSTLLVSFCPLVWAPPSRTTPSRLCRLPSFAALAGQQRWLAAGCPASEGRRAILSTTKPSTGPLVWAQTVRHGRRNHGDCCAACGRGAQR